MALLTKADLLAVELDDDRELVDIIVNKSKGILATKEILYGVWINKLGVEIPKNTKYEDMTVEEQQVLNLLGKACKILYPTDKK